MQKPTVQRKVSVPPDVTVAAARKRVEKLEAVLVTLGEDDDTVPVIQEVLKKARAQAQERPVSESRVASCSWRGNANESRLPVKQRQGSGKS